MAGNGLEPILAEERAEVARTQREGDLLRSTLIGLLVLLALVPAALAAGYVVYGRERRAADYDRDYEQEPPSDLEPTMVNALVNRIHRCSCMTPFAASPACHHARLSVPVSTRRNRARARLGQPLDGDRRMFQAVAGIAS